MSLNLRACQQSSRGLDTFDKPLVFNNHEKHSHFSPTTKLAIFDLDDTLTTTRSGAFFPKDVLDWKVKFPHVMDQLRMLHTHGYTLVVISNQMGIFREHINKSEFENRVKSFWEQLNAPLLVLAACRDDEYRKPAIGNYLYLISDVLKLRFKTGRGGDSDVPRRSPRLSSRIPDVKTPGRFDFKLSEDALTKDDTSAYYSHTSSPISRRNKASHPVPGFTPGGNFYLNMTEASEFGLGAEISELSFFCGDAAGRDSTHTKDFSNSDLLFAYNCRLNFYLPEQVFLGEQIPALPKKPTWPYSSFIENNKKAFLSSIPVQDWISWGKSNVLVLLVGPSSSGKTTLCDTVFKEFTKIDYVSSSDS
jgi:DNA 3'-phosphatase